MAKAKKMPSGQWRTLVYSHTDLVDGRKVRRYESFTAPTKKESEFLAAQFLLKKSSTYDPRISFGAALEKYIKSKEHILSPSTIVEYRNIEKNYFDMLKPMQISKITMPMIQTAINEISFGHAAKTVKNAYGLLTATFSMFRPDFSIRVTLPKIHPQPLPVPDDEDFLRLLSLAKDTQLYIPILLAAVLSLRRSEICGLQWQDIDQHRFTLTVRRSIVRCPSATTSWTVSTPKTIQSGRSVLLPPFLLSLLLDMRPKKFNLTDFIFDFTPDKITNGFRRMLKKNQLPNFRFHSLRHYSASVMLALNVPDKYAMERGGWSDFSVMKNRYQHTFTKQRYASDVMINEYFSNLFFHEENATRNATR